MLSNDYETKIKINKKELMECIERASLLIREGDKKPIIFTIEEGKMEIRIDTTTGSMEEEVFIDKEGKDIKIGFNPKFVIDALKVIDEEEIDMYFVNPKAPCFIREKEGKYIYLILPVNFSTAN
jgi:DNA polymerase-3 subunit beta